ncbi:MAG: hypothetical protein JXA33_05475 [Anaerolineae bacterium]|nr:hypothetical protein [Anaerolineae bacterium]
MKREIKQAWDDLPPEVRQTLKRLQPVPPPDSQAWMVGRQAFLAEAQSLTSQIVTSEREFRHKKQSAPTRENARAKSRLFWRRSTMGALLKVVLVIGLLLGGTVGTVGASQHSLPGSLLYPVKLQIEDWRLASIRDPLPASSLALSLAQERVDEAVRLYSNAVTIPTSLGTRYQAHLAFALHAAGTLTASLKLQTQQRISQTLAIQQRTMAQLMQQLHTGAGQNLDAQVLAAMVQTAQRAQRGITDDLSPGGPPEDAPRQQLGPGDGTDTGSEGEGQFGSGDGREDCGSGGCAGSGNGNQGTTNDDTDTGNAPGESQNQGGNGGAQDDDLQCHGNHCDTGRDQSDAGQDGHSQDKGNSDTGTDNDAGNGNGTNGSNGNDTGEGASGGNDNRDASDSGNDNSGNAGNGSDSDNAGNGSEDSGGSGGDDTGTQEGGNGDGSGGNGGGNSGGNGGSGGGGGRS